MDLGFAGATAVVTGGSKGMGLAIAEGLGAEGASVAIMARGQAALDSAARQIRSAGAPEVLTISVDMSDTESIASAFASVGHAWDSLNVLVHTVGPNAGAFEDLDDDDWHAAFELGTLSAVRSVRAALPMLRAAEWARIVTLSAHSIQRQSPRLVAYTATKSALSSFTKNLSKSLGAEGILVNCVCPGTIVTASFTETLREVLAAGGAGLIGSQACDDMGRADVRPSLRRRSCRFARRGRIRHRLSGVTTKRLRDGGHRQRRRRVRLHLIRGQPSPRASANTAVAASRSSGVSMFPAYSTQHQLRAGRAPDEIAVTEPKTCSGLPLDSKVKV